LIGGLSMVASSTWCACRPGKRRLNEVGHLGTPRARHTATLLADHRILVTGALTQRTTHSPARRSPARWLASERFAA
jgi:hypothetical protein